MSSESGSKAVTAALASNVGIAVGKLGAFAFTGSASMLAESIHSLADSGNQVLLLLGSKRARRQATAEHPFGYGRDRYVHAFIVAVVLFSAGGLFATYDGIKKIVDSLEHHQGLDHWGWAVGVLALAVLLESLSFRTAMRESKPMRGTKSWARFVHESKSPELLVVLFEDFGALIGLFLALSGVVASIVTGDAVYDGISTVAIGALLICIALVLMTETRSLLLGESAVPEAVEAIEAALAGVDGIERVIHLRTMHLSPEQLLVGAKIAVGRKACAEEIAKVIDDAEEAVRASVPLECVIYLEPDIDRAPTT